jgi:NAD(P)-dependent dehydrogenase (short-subunit alcohol dehydrogenase family)
MDLMDPESIAAFADRFLSTGEPLDILVNNAGIMWMPLQLLGMAPLKRIKAT